MKDSQHSYGDKVIKGSISKANNERFSTKFLEFGNTLKYIKGE